MKTLRLMATLLLALAVAGCSFGRSTSPSATTAPPASATSAPEPTAAPPTAAPPDEPTETVVAEPTEEPTAEQAEEPTEEPAEEATEAPTDEPAEEATPEATGEAVDEPAEEAAADEPLYLSIIWHQHQPVYYKDPETGIYAKPWVRLHATKDYVDMADLVDRYPNVHVTFNLTPSLLRQVLDLEAGAKDAYWVATERPAEELTAEEKRFILRRFFDINPKIVDDFPRYVELQEMRGSAGSDEELDALAAEWSAQDFRDLQLLFNLGWTDPDWRAQPPLDALVEKGRDFTEEDKAIVLARHAELIADVIPVHAALLVNGKIEVTMTPYAHPILPLLVSTDLAREAMPDARLPAPPFQFGQDAQAQLQRGVELYTEIFGFAPSGMWPGEGSVAEEIVTMVSRAGITWMASDEEVLAKSLGLNQFQRDSAETVQEADDLYRPYYVQGGGGGPVAMVFRDRTISDKVGFTYSGMDGSQAAADFLQRIENIRQQLAGQPGPHLVTVILDGENAWEHYENDGKEFLNALYQGLAESETIETVTPSEYLELYPEQREIEDLWAGSWINADYSTWIGEDEENKAWALLLEARQRLQRYIGGRDEADAAAIERATDLMYIAEGSDWFWWYGSDQDSGDDGAFDAQFRDTLIEMYEVLGAEVPDELRVPLIAATAQEPAVGAQGLITVTVDGVAAQGEWELAGRYDVVGGVAQRADDVVGSIYYGFDARTVYVRLDARTSWADLGPDGSVGVYIGTARATDTAPFSRFGGGGQTVLGFDAGYLTEVRLSDGALAGEATLTAAERGEWAEEPLLTIPAALQGQTIEMAIPLEAFGEFEAGDMIDVRVVASRAGADIQALPATGIARLFVPDLGLTTALLTVADPEGDDHGPGSYTYPTDAVFQPGAFDITEFVVAEDENNLVFRLTVTGGIENVWTSPRGISVQTFDVYIDTGQGTARKLLPGRNAAVAEGGWDYAVWLEGWEGGLYEAQAEGNPEEVQGAEIRTVVDGPAGRVTIKVPKSALPEGDPREWRYLAGVLGQEGFPSTGVWRVRDVAPRAQQWRFGGALPGTNGTRFIDLALPADSPVSQEEALTPPVESDEANPDNFAPEDLAQVPMVEVGP